MADNPPKVDNKDKITKLLMIIAGAGAVTFLAGFGLDLSDTSIAAAKDALNSGVEALIAVLLSGAGVVGLKAVK